MEDRSWNGQWTLDELLVNDKLDVDIAAQYCDDSHTCQSNMILLDLQIMPGFFGHLEQFLGRYIDHLSYGEAMMRKFHDFITTHPALKSSLSRLALIDDIYSAHQSLSRDAKRFMQAILNSMPLVNDWSLVFEDELDFVYHAAPIHKYVYEHHTWEIVHG